MALTAPLLFAALIAVGTPMVTLRTPPPAASGIAGFPRIVAPQSDAARRINTALTRLNDRVRSAAKDCLAGGGTHQGDWDRQIDTPMRGPEFLSYVITDDVDCGGAHPNTGHAAIVYDLTTGEPVDWTKLLPNALRGKLALQSGEDGVRMVTLASLRLTQLYRQAYDRGPADADQKACREAVASQASEGPIPMLAWLDAKGGGLALQFDFAHVEQVCSEPMLIPTAVLAREGASKRLIEALETAHAEVKVPVTDKPR